MLAPTIIVLMVVGVFPLVAAVWISVTDLHFALPGRDGSWVGASNYTALVADSRYWSSIARSVLFVAICVPIEAALGTLAALAIRNAAASSRLLTIGLTVPILIAPITAGLMWRLLLHGDYGPIGYWFFAASGHSLLAESTFAFVTICAVDVWQWLPFFILLMLLGMNTCPSSAIIAAKLDGASDWQVSTHVLIPWAKPVLTLGITIRLLDSFKEMEKIHALTGGGPASATEVQNVYAAIVTFVQGNVAMGAAMCLLTFLFLVIAVNVVIPRVKDVLR